MDSGVYLEIIDVHRIPSVLDGVTLERDRRATSDRAIGCAAVAHKSAPTSVFLCACTSSVRYKSVLCTLEKVVEVRQAASIIYAHTNPYRSEIHYGSRRDGNRSTLGSEYHIH